jgi:phage terminase large subunit-like protein
MENPLAQQAKAWLDDRLAALLLFEDADGAEYQLLSRIQQFPFEKYPDTTIPWHLFQWKHMRWGYVALIVELIESFKHVKGPLAGTYIELEPFQVLTLVCFLAPYDPSTNTRLVSTALLTIGRKNAKSTLIAALLTALMALRPDAGGHYRQEFFVGASDRKQASEIYDMVSGIITQDTDFGLVDKFKCVPSGKLVQHLQTLTKLEVLSSDAYRAHGRNAVGVVYDETGNLPNILATDFYSVLTSGFGAQEEPLAVLMSTQAPVDAHIFSEFVDRCKNLNAGKEDFDLDDALAGVVFEVPGDVDVFDESKWYLANPGLLSPLGLGRTLLRDLRKQAKEAKSTPSIEAKFRNRRMNQRANPFNPLITGSVWAANSRSYTEEELRGRRMVCAADLSSVRDLTALVGVFEPIDGVCPVIAQFWTPGHGLDAKEREDKVPYLTWAKQGYINADADKTVDYRLVVETLDDWDDKYEIRGVGYDRWKMGDLKAHMGDRWTDRINDERFLIEIFLGTRYQELMIQSLEKALFNGLLGHGQHPVLTWNATNCVVRHDVDGNRRFDKAKSYGRIDGVVSLAMALRAKELLDAEPDNSDAWVKGTFVF